MRSKWLRGAVAAMALMVAGGCGAAATPAAASKPASAPPATGGPAPAAQAGGGPAVKLTFDYPVGVAGPLAKIMDHIVARFDATHPGIHVTPVFSGSYQQTLAKVETAIQAGNPPAVAVLNHTAVFDLLHLKAIQPLDTIVRQGDFYPAMLLPKVQGHYWGAPYQRSTVVLYYNRTLFRKAGLNPNHGPQTWQQIVTDGKAIEKLGVAGIEIPSDGTSYWQFQPFAIEAGQNLAANNGTTVYFNSPAATKALQFWWDLSHKYHVEPAGILPWNTVPAVFEAGKTGMLVHSSGSMASILKGSHFHVGVSFMPRGASPYRTDMGGGDLYVFKGLPAAQTKAAKTFIRWMTAPPQAAAWSIDTGYVAVTPKAYQQPAMKKYVAQYPQALVAPAQLKYAQPELSTYQLNQVQDTMDSAIQSVIDGQSGVSAALDRAQQQAKAILAPYR